MFENQYINILGLIAIIVILEICAQSNFKMNSHNGDIKYYALGVFFYALLGLFLIEMYKYKGMGMTNALWSSISVISILLVGHLYWKEPITRLDLLGVIVALIGITLILYNPDETKPII